MKIKKIASYYCKGCGKIIEEDTNDKCGDCRKKDIPPENPITQPFMRSMPYNKGH
jgi:hypothetical protein